MTRDFSGHKADSVKQRLSPEYRLALQVAVGLLLIYLSCLAPGIYSSDGASTLAVSESLVTQHNFTVPENVGTPGVGGRFYSNWYPLLAVLAVPFVFAALLVSHLTGLPFHYLAEVSVLPMMGALVAATAGAVVVLALRLGADTKGAWLAGVSFGLGTVALAYARVFYADSLLAFLTVTALCLTIGGSRRELALAACFAGLAVLAKPTGVLLAPILSAYLLLKRAPLRICLLPLIGASVAGVFYMGYNVMRFGHPLDFGRAMGFDPSVFLSGFSGLLVSPGCGLFWYCPPVVLALFAFPLAVRQKKCEALAIVTVFAAFHVFHAFYLDWRGGWSWGPRYLLPGIPGLCALAGLMQGRSRKALVVLTLLGFLLSAPTLFTFYERYFAELSQQGIHVGTDTAWSLRHAPLLHIWPGAFREIQDARGMNASELFGQREVPRYSVEESRALRIVAVWWWVLPVVHVPRWIGFLVALLLAMLGSVILARKLLPPWQPMPQERPVFVP